MILVVNLYNKVDNTNDLYIYSNILIKKFIDYIVNNIGIKQVLFTGKIERNIYELGFNNYQYSNVEFKFLNYEIDSFFVVNNNFIKLVCNEIFADEVLFVDSRYIFMYDSIISLIGEKNRSAFIVSSINSKRKDDYLTYSNILFGFDDLDNKIKNDKESVCNIGFLTINDIINIKKNSDIFGVDKKNKTWISNDFKIYLEYVNYDDIFLLMNGEDDKKVLKIGLSNNQNYIYTNKDYIASEDREDEIEKKELVVLDDGYGYSNFKNEACKIFKFSDINYFHPEEIVKYIKGNNIDILKVIGKKKAINYAKNVKYLYETTKKESFAYLSFEIIYVEESDIGDGINTFINVYNDKNVVANTVIPDNIGIYKRDSAIEHVEYYIKNTFTLLNYIVGVCSSNSTEYYINKFIESINNFEFNENEYCQKQQIDKLILKIVLGDNITSGIANALDSIAFCGKEVAFLYTSVACCKYIFSNLSNIKTNISKKIISDRIGEICNNLQFNYSQEVYNFFASMLNIFPIKNKIRISEDIVNDIYGVITAEEIKNTCFSFDKKVLKKILEEINNIIEFNNMFKTIKMELTQFYKKEFNYNDMVDMYEMIMNIEIKYTLEETYNYILNHISHVCSVIDTKFIVVGYSGENIVSFENFINNEYQIFVGIERNNISKFIEELENNCNEIGLKIVKSKKNGNILDMYVYKKNTIFVSDYNIGSIDGNKHIRINILQLYEIGNRHNCIKLFNKFRLINMEIERKNGYDLSDEEKIKSTFFYNEKLRACDINSLYEKKNKIINQITNNGGDYYYMGNYDFNCIIDKSSVYNPALYKNKDIELPYILIDNMLKLKIPNIYKIETSLNFKYDIFADKPQKAQSTFFKRFIFALKYKLKLTKYSIKKFIPEMFIFIKKNIKILKTKLVGFFRGMGMCISPNSKNIKKYKNKYSGQRCFLIGNGPSLVAEDLEKIIGEYSFGCNFIHKIYNQTSWRPTFHCISDSSTVRVACWDILNNLDEDKTTMIIRDFPYEKMPIKPKSALVVPSISADVYKIHDNFLAYHYISHATVMSMMIEAAVYMGFSEMYLLGVDATTSSDKGGNFAANYFTTEIRQKLDVIKKKAIKDYNVEKRRSEIAERQRIVYAKLNKYVNKKGLKIYNATRGGSLDVFKRVNLEDVLNKKI